MSGPEDPGLERLRRPSSPDFRNRPVGAVIGVVTDNRDPAGMGRVKVRFPWLHDEVVSHWARVAQPYAGPGRGAFWLPEIGDEVVAMFDRGDPNHPYILGGVWNGEDAVPPPGNPDGENNHKIWQTRKGHKIVFEDTEGGEKVTITDGPGERHLVIDVAADTITLTADPGDITFRAPEKSVSVHCVNLEVMVSGDSTWRADTTLTDSCTERVETITGADEVKVKETWAIETKSALVRPAASRVEATRLAASVTGDLRTSHGAKKAITAPEISREAGDETATIGQLRLECGEGAGDLVWMTTRCQARGRQAPCWRLVGGRGKGSEAVRKVWGGCSGRPAAAERPPEGAGARFQDARGRRPAVAAAMER